MDIITQDYLNDLVDSITREFTLIIQNKKVITNSEFEEWKVQNRFDPKIQEALCEYMALDTFEDCLGILKMEVEHSIRG